MELENRQLNISDDGDIFVNETGVLIEGFTWPELSGEFFNGVRRFISNILILSIVLIISRKCIRLKLAKTAEHTFYCTVAVVFCMSESVLFSYNIFHMALGLMAFGLGAMGTGIEICHMNMLALKHFRSKHSIFALIGSTLITITIATGIWMLVQDVSKRNAIMLQLIHRISAMCSYVTLMTSQVFSYNKGFMRRNWSESYILVLKYFTFIATITVCALELKHFAADVLETIDEKMHYIIPKQLFLKE